MPRREPTCQRCGRHLSFNPLDAWIVIERAPNTMPLTYARRFCTACISPEEVEQRNRVLARRAELRARRMGVAAPEATRLSDSPVDTVEEAIDTYCWERNFGVEIEFIGDTRRVVDGIIAAGDRCEAMHYTHNVVPQWKIVSDGSISGVGGELVSPILSSQAGMRRLRAACRGLRSASASINRSCGLHVHHEAVDLDRKTVVNLLHLYAANQRLINQMLSPSRRANHYAQNMNAGQIDRWIANVDYYLRGTDESDPNYFATFMARLSGSANTRYTAVNVQAWDRHQTIEFRQHQGSTNYRRISQWVRFGQAMIEYARNRSEIVCRTSFMDHGTMLAAFSLCSDDRQYWGERVAEFAQPDFSER